jgi:peptidoglycan/LPS O-acetylase OafA/YrhL
LFAYSFFMNFLKLAQPGRVYGLDCLRAFAIIAVMLAHGLTYLPEQWRLPYQFLVFDGVSLFFVLSGFLIGTILLKTTTREAPTLPVLRDFLVKRWVRTVPPYFLILLLVCLLEWLPYTSTGNGDFRLSIVWRFFFFLQNLRKAHPFFFQESWSLPVEEVFYLVVPASVFVLLRVRFKPLTAFLTVAITLLVAVTFYRFYKYLHFPAHLLAASYDQDFRKIVITRLDSLMYGVLAACWSYYAPASWGRHAKLKFIVGASILLLHQPIALLCEPGLYLCVFYFSVMSLGAMLLLPAASQLRTGRGLTARVLTHVSLISYSMYLLNATVLNQHLIEPLLPKLGLQPGSTAYFVVGTVAFWSLTVLLSTLLYKYFEVPVMAMRSQPAPAKLVLETNYAIQPQKTV